MARTGRIRRRLAVAIALTALIPLLGAIYFARSMVRATAARFYRPEIGARLDESLGLYKELARVQKESLRHQARAIARDPALEAAVEGGGGGEVGRVLRKLVGQYPSAVSIAVETPDGEPLATADRGRPVDDEKEFRLDVEEELGGGAGAIVSVVFATDRARFEGLESMSEFVEMYDTIAERRHGDEQTYVVAFGVLLGLAIVLAILVGSGLAGGVSRRIAALASATRRVGRGDLDTRVDESGADELGELARAFNSMLVEVQTSRARIEYLQRIGAWQEMARRLAHEIKNPLTPIQLAMEEIHQRYDGDSDAHRKLLDDALDVVQTEVGTLRRLVGEFSDFARLPQAHLEPGDLVRVLSDHSTAGDYVRRDRHERDVDVVFDVPFDSAPAYIDRQMMGRVLANLVRNAKQAVRDKGPGESQIRVTLGRDGDYWVVDVDDDGPGIPRAMRERIFDPYVTTKSDGTGLGLAIVKKIVVEHGGSIEATSSPLGGARIRVAVPATGTAPSLAALSQEHADSEARGSSTPPAHSEAIAS